MKQSNRNKLLTEARNSVMSSISSANLSAYPHLQPVMYNIAVAIDHILTQDAIIESLEALHGESETAKLYKIVTGKDIKIPIDIIDEFGSNYHLNDPLSVIGMVKYWMRTNKNTIYHVCEDWFNLSIVFEDGEFKAFIFFPDNDMSVAIPDLARCEAYAKSPLHEDDISFRLRPEWIHEHIYQYVYATLTKDIEVYEGKPGDLFELHYLTQEIIDDPDSPYNQLVDLKHRHYINDVKVPFREDYEITLGLESSYSTVNGAIVRLPKINGVYSTKEKWHLSWEKNPLIIRDIIEDMDILINRAIKVTKEKFE